MKLRTVVMRVVVGAGLMASTPALAVFEDGGGGSVQAVQAVGATSEAQETRDLEREYRAFLRAKRQAVTPVFTEAEEMRDLERAYRAHRRALAQAAKVKAAGLTPSDDTMP